MRFAIDHSAPEPIFAQLAAQIRAAVLTGGLTPGTALPGARDVATALDINVHTVLHAYQVLRDESVIELRRGRGAVVLDAATGIDEPMQAAVTAIAAHARRLGLSAATVTTLVAAAIAHLPATEGEPA